MSTMTFSPPPPPQITNPIQQEVFQWHIWTDQPAGEGSCCLNWRVLCRGGWSQLLWHQGKCVSSHLRPGPKKERSQAYMLPIQDILGAKPSTPSCKDKWRILFLAPMFIPHCCHTFQKKNNWGKGTKWLTKYTLSMKGVWVVVGCWKMI